MRVILTSFNRIGQSLSLLGRRYVVVAGSMVTINTKSLQVSNMHGRPFPYTVVVYCVDPTLRAVRFQWRIWGVSTNVHGHTFAYCNGWKHTKLCKSYFPCVHSPYSGTRNRRTIVAVRLGSFSTSILFAPRIAKMTRKTVLRYLNQTFERNTPIYTDSKSRFIHHEAWVVLRALFRSPPPFILYGTSHRKLWTLLIGQYNWYVDKSHAGSVANFVSVLGFALFYLFG